MEDGLLPSFDGIFFHATIFASADSYVRRSALSDQNTPILMLIFVGLYVLLTYVQPTVRASTTGVVSIATQGLRFLAADIIDLAIAVCRTTLAILVGSVCNDISNNLTGLMLAVCLYSMARWRMHAS